MSQAYRGPVRLVIFDVDGVLTDGSLHMGADGEVYKTFSARDGVAFALLRAHGMFSAIISGKSSKALDYRGQELRIDRVVTGCLDKFKAYNELKRELGLEDEQVVFVGDDVIDLPVMRLVGSSYAPNDAHPLALQSATYVTRAFGGRGVAREVVEHVLLLGGIGLEQAHHRLLAAEEALHVQQ
ncbi:3-deoxy-D-manno-octulosonate 8-phosphate phosphatase KdsC [compost metagenome]